MLKQILIIGATSEIAKAIVEVFDKSMKDDCIEFILCARDITTLESLYKNTTTNNINIMELDVCNFWVHREFIESFNNIHGVIYVAGYMPKQQDAQANFHLAKQSMDVNILGAISLLELIANRFEMESNNAHKNRFIIAISSVSGDRGRASNYIYGCSKAALSAYMQGLANRFGLQEQLTVRILCVRAGFTNTKSLQGITLGMLSQRMLVASPTKLAKDIYKALQGNKTNIYSKWTWKPIMIIIRLLPSRIFNKMKL